MVIMGDIFTYNPRVCYAHNLLVLQMRFLLLDMPFHIQLPSVARLLTL